MSTVEWWRIRDQSLGLAAREAGFDLAVYESYSPAVQQSLKACAIKLALRNLRDAFEDVAGRPLYEVTEGVYVICLSYPFALQYPLGVSEIVYIGRGNLSTRIKSHYEKTLFKLMRSLAGSSYDFYLTEPKSGNPEYFKHIEYLLLDRFRDKIGGGSYPILNKNAGWDQGLTKVGKGWDRPLKQSGKKPIWTVWPTKHFDLAALD